MEELALLILFISYTNEYWLSLNIFWTHQCIIVELCAFWQDGILFWMYLQRNIIQLFLCAVRISLKSKKWLKFLIDKVFSFNYEESQTFYVAPCVMFIGVMFYLFFFECHTLGLINSFQHF